MKIPYLLICCMCLLSCTNKVLVTDCPSKICTQEFRSVSVKFKDSAGKPILVKDFSAIIKRTGKSTKLYPTDTTYSKGSYSVVTDFDTKNLLPEGDTIVVSAVNPTINQKRIVQFVVSGGKCACHIQKVSGPEEVVFD